MTGLLEKAEKCLDAWTDMAVEAKTFFATKNKTTGPSAISAEVEAEKKKRTRRTKAEIAAADAAGAAASAAATKAAADATKMTDMTEEESKTKANDLAHALIKRFPTVSAEDQAAGVKRTEGFYMAKKILDEKFKAPLKDLTHIQRVQFIADIETLIAEANKATATPAQPATPGPTDL